MVLLLLSLLSSSSAWNWQEGHFGRCGVETMLESFNLDFFNCPFYQVVRSNIGPSAVGECIYRTSVKDTEFSEYSVIYMAIDGVEYQKHAYFQYSPIPGKRGQFTMTVNGLILTGAIIATDLETYAVIYFCSSMKYLRRDYIEFFSTDPHFNFSSFLHLAYERGFTDNDLYFTVQYPDMCYPYTANTDDILIGPKDPDAPDIDGSTTGTDPAVPIPDPPPSDEP